jgi:hypothetical protein
MVLGVPTPLWNKMSMKASSPLEKNDFTQSWTRRIPQDGIRQYHRWSNTSVGNHTEGSISRTAVMNTVRIQGSPERRDNQRGQQVICSYLFTNSGLDASEYELRNHAPSLEGQKKGLVLLRSTCEGSNCAKPLPKPSGKRRNEFIMD